MVACAQGAGGEVTMRHVRSSPFASRSAGPPFLISALPLYLAEPFVPATLRANPNVIFTSERTPTGVPKSSSQRARTSGMTSLTLESATIDPVKSLYMMT